jgi:hypothetical protein
VRFLYAVTLGRETLDLMASIPHMKRATGRANDPHLDRCGLFTRFSFFGVH